MIKINNSEVTGVYAAKQLVLKIYSGVKVVYAAIKSCFSEGYWIDYLPWSDDDGWKD